MAAKVVQLRPETGAKRAAEPRRASSGELTVARIAALKPAAKRYWETDAKTPGLAVRVTPAGAKAFYVRGRIGGGRRAPWREVRIAGTDEITLKDARARALDLMAKLRAGEDPTAPRKGAATLGELLDGYQASLEARGVVKARDVMVSLRRGLRRYARLPAGDLERVQVVAEINGIERDGRPGAAQYLRKNATAFLNWAANEGHLAANVMAGYRRERATRAQRIERPRITFRKPDELRAFWRATDAASNPMFRDLLRFLLLTGLRRGEGAGLRWDHVDGDRIAIPAEITKTGVAHVAPLGPMGRALLETQPRVAGAGVVFPGRHGGEIKGWTQLLAPVRAALGAPDFAPHALRRSFRTGLEELGVPVSVCEAMIAHKRDDLAARYSVAELWEARAEAQARWEAHLAEIVA